MNQDIHAHLEKLKTELNKLEPAVKHLQKADDNATALITALNNIHIEFAKHLQNIEKSFTAANEKYHKQLSKEIQDSSKKISDAAAQLSKSNSAFENQIKSFLSGYERLANTASKLIEKIDKVDFPTRLDKLDSTVSSINQGLQNTQMRIGDLERNIKDDLQSRSKELKSKVETTEISLKKRLDSSEKNTDTQFEALFKVNKLIKTLLFVSIGLSVVMIIIHFLYP